MTFPSGLVSRIEQALSTPRRVVVLVTAATILLTAGVVALHAGPKPFGDGEYDQGARELVELIRGDRTETPIVKKGALPVLYYAVPYLFVPDGAAERAYLFSAISWNCLWNVIAVILVWEGTRRSWGEREAALSVGLLFLFPLHIYYGAGVLAEPPAFLATALLFFGWGSWRASKYKGPFTSPKWWSLLAGLCCLLLARANLIFMAPFVLGACTIFWCSSSQRRKAWPVGSAVAVLVAASLTLAVDRAVSVLDPDGGAYRRHVILNGLVMGRYEFRQNTWDWTPWQRNFRGGTADYEDQHSTSSTLFAECREAPGSCDRVFIEWALRDIAENPGLFLKQVAVKAVQSQVFFPFGSIRRSGIAQAATVLIGLAIFLVSMFFAGAWAVFLVRERRLWGEFWPFWAIWLGTFIGACAFHSEPRYMFPARLFMIVATAVVFAGNPARSSLPENGYSQYDLG